MEIYTYKGGLLERQSNSIEFRVFLTDLSKGN